MNDSGTRMQREVAYWMQYFLIAFVASSVAYSVLESAQRVGPGSEQIDFSSWQVDINIKQMVLSMWYGYYRWWFFTFVIVSAIRFSLVFILDRPRRMVNKNVHPKGQG